MKAFVSFLLFSFLGASHSIAGFKVGNGGNVVVCGENAKRTVELLDHWEARKIRHLNIQMGPSDLTPQEKVQLVLERLKKINPNRAALYEYWFKTFMDETDFTEMNIISNADSGPAKLDPGCAIVQIAIQQEPDLPGDIRYTIQKDLWAELDNNGKAGLILHELIYRELANQKPAHLTSKYVRYYNAFISSDQPSSVRLNEYYKLMLSLQFAVIDTQYDFPIYILLENEDGSIRNAEVRFSESNPDFVQFVQARALFAEFHSQPQYVWQGQTLELVDPRYSGSTMSPLHFNKDGTPVEFSARARPLKIEFGSLRGVLTSAQATAFSVSDDKDYVKRFNVDAFSDEVRFADIEFAGTYKNQPVQWQRPELTYDPEKDEVIYREPRNCRACQ